MAVITLLDCSLSSLAALAVDAADTLAPAVFDCDISNVVGCRLSVVGLSV